MLRDRKPQLEAVPGGLAVRRALDAHGNPLLRAQRMVVALHLLEDDDIADLLQDYILPDMLVGDPKSEIITEAIRRLSR